MNICENPWPIFLCLNVFVVGANSGKPLRGVAAIAITFWASSAYLCVIGLGMLASPGTLSMALGAPLLNGLELSGPYMFLLVAAVGGLIGWGLWRRNRWARRVAILVGLIGLVFTLPGLSIEVINFRWSLVWPGLSVLLRMLIVWYLYQAPVTEWFAGRAPNTPLDS